MSKVLNFLADYYILFIIISVVLLIALIGFIVGERKKKKKAEAGNDLPINNNESEPQNVPASPAMSVIPENNIVDPQLGAQAVEPTVSYDAQTPVMPAQNQVFENPQVVMEQSPVFSETVVPQTQDSLVQTPEVPQMPEATMQPSLVIDDPAAPVSPAVPETPVVPEVSAVPASQAPTVEVPVNTQPSDVSAAPSLVIEAPVQSTEVVANNAPVQTAVPEPVPPVEAPVEQAPATPSIFENNQNN